MATHTVVKGDTLWSIAKKYLGGGGHWGFLADINGISRSRPWIYPGQVLKLDVEGSSSSYVDTTNNTNKPTIEYFGIQAGTDTSIYAVWKWDKSNTKEYQVIWYYYVNDIWFKGNDTKTEDKESVYSAPSNALKVKVKVKPISKTYTSNNKEVSYWTAEWSTEKIFSFADEAPPKVPSTPSVEIEKYKLTARLANIEGDPTAIQFEVVKVTDGIPVIFKTALSTVRMGHVQYSCYIDAGSSYRVRCRANKGDLYSDWSAYSQDQETIPTPVSEITECKGVSENSIYLVWRSVPNATGYDIEYTTKKEYFDSSSQTSTESCETPSYYVTNLETGKEYFFRVRSKNEQGETAWSEIVSCVIGTTPIAPTTWSSTTTVIAGENLTFYWIHNSEDKSSQTWFEIELVVDGMKDTITIDTSAEEDDEKTMFYSIDTSAYVDVATYVDGGEIEWRVRTAGATKTFGEWSIQRSVNIYVPPVLSLSVTDVDGNAVDTLTSFPMYISGIATPDTQTPLGYTVSIVSKDIYETVDEVGNVKVVNAGEVIYSKHFITSDRLVLELHPGHVNLENNVNYELKCVVSMNSGLTDEDSCPFKVSWTDEYYAPNAEIGIDTESLTASIRPYCEDENGIPIPDITLSVYRREFDGSFTELATGIDNNSNTFITDPHPSLDYARYRIVAVTNNTGSISYYDVPGYPVGEPGIVIQWDEAWSSFDPIGEDEMEKPTWSGSMLKLPYNVDISDNNNADVSMVEYIGRKHPVSYYGTQLGESSKWNAEIDKKDTASLYALRRLAKWMGDVYVREPSGSGYWANVSVSFNQRHTELTIPISLSVTRVAGGA